MKEFLIDSAIERGFLEEEICFFEDWESACIGFTVVNENFYVLYSFENLVCSENESEDQFNGNITLAVQERYECYKEKIILVYSKELLNL